MKKKGKKKISKNGSVNKFTAGKKTEYRDDNIMNNIPTDDLNIEKILTQEDVERCRKEIVELKKERKYNAVMEKIISLFNAGHTDADLMLDLAQIYYDTQDYARAETWAANSYNKSGDLDTLIFLAKIYSTDDKMDKMAEILNKILGNDSDLFSEEQKKSTDDMVFYIELTYESDEIAEKFPNIAKGMEKEDILPEADFEEEKFVDKVENIFTDNENNHIEIENNTLTDETEIGPDDSQREEKIDGILQEMANGGNISDKDFAFVMRYPSAVITEGVNSLHISLTKKILLYNYIAASYYENNRFSDAIKILQEALAIDDQDDLILKNIGFVFFEQGDKGKAKIALQAVKNKDFMLCDLLKKCDGQ
ncbi:tetratricopeptide repeat protein [Pectinatus haikarae]|uniref:Tetratricopeptide (TPR) repeat protein n=1 Tax=Pectinatus haikarae TaxID=349096 RepID=A0ABT9YBC4_9FIRM|nr:tetratricopeptide repeat protein [Pectinatus haikarae]MDQ0205145.1 tetratricopeptide (TPR) repeat protein [Pectinatus haikarae]